MVVKQDMVSCLCLTRNRTKLLHRAISCFYRQTWINKELVIVYDFDDIATENFLQNYKDKPEIKIVQNTREKPSVGFLRNISVRNATGPYVIQWDDDDFYGNNRIKFMMNSLKKSRKRAVVLNTWYSIYVNKKKLVQAPFYTYEGSILTKKGLLLKFPYPDWTRRKTKNGGEIGEDTHVIRQLRSKGLLHAVHNPKVYFYLIHGNNTCSDEHFARMFKSSKQVTNGKQLYKNVMRQIALDDANYEKKLTMKQILATNNTKDKSQTSDEPDKIELNNTKDKSEIVEPKEVLCS